MASGYIVGKSDTRLEHGCIFIVKSGSVQSPSHAGKIELVYAPRPYVRLTGGRSEFGIRISGMAQEIIRRTDELVADT